MFRLSTVVFALIAAASAVSAQQCSGNTAICPNHQDGVSSTYLQCDSWAKKYITVACPSGQVCFANPKTPNTVMCAPPGSGGVPSAGTCTGNTAKCASPGQSGDYFTCESWSGQYVKTSCPAGLKCHNNASNTGVQCY
ncbi:hypothetical protein LPJ53_000342 [Coemansia erecta]|uniref:Uncharacterized protein n=1 Tax=Coemansia erecta TaxID=147472 RepID=A0A9W7Y6N8_9FUNG|nr:hypothetical protein LPJ53_000342 [Coemansia erecta]